MGMKERKNLTSSIQICDTLNCKEKSNLNTNVAEINLASTVNL